MKVVLINPAYLYIYGADRIAVSSHFPLGLGYVASVLLRNGHDVRFIDAESENLPPDALEEKLRQESPDMVGITCTTATFLSAIEISKAVRKASRCPIVLGGPHASVLPELTLEKYSGYFDILVIGEGEDTITELCLAYENKDPKLDRIKGIAYQEGGVYKRTAPRTYIENLDSIPMPARHIVNMGYYFQPNAFNNLGKRSATIFTSRGCPYNCAFCASQVIWGRRVRYHSPERVIDEMLYLNKEYKIEHILIKDDTFTIDRNRVKEICELIIKNALKIKFSCLARVDCVDQELLKLMKKAGFHTLCFGVESGDEEVLKKLKKGITTQQAETAVMLAKKFGFRVHCTFMIGNPGDTRQTVLKTIKFAKVLNPTLALFYIMVPYPGTEVFERYLKDSFEQNPRWEDFVISKGSAFVDIENLTKTELKELLSLAYRSFYLRPAALWNILRETNELKDVIIFLRGGWGLFKRVLNLNKKMSELSKDFKKQEQRYWDLFWSKRKVTPLGNLLCFIRERYLTEKLGDILISHTKAGRILEAGSGTAAGSIYVAGKRGDKICALDISRKALDIAQEGARKKGVCLEIRQGDIYKMDFPDRSFDVVWNIGVLEYSQDPSRIVSEMKRVGKACISCVPAKGLFWILSHKLASFLQRENPVYVKWFTARELKDIFIKTGFQKVIIKTANCLFFFSFHVAIGIEEE